MAGFDCPVLPSMWDIVARVAGASLTAARCLSSGGWQVALQWCGGWHHAHRWGDAICFIILAGNIYYHSQNTKFTYDEI